MSSTAPIGQYRPLMLGHAQQTARLRSNRCPACSLQPLHIQQPRIASQPGLRASDGRLRQPSLAPVASSSPATAISRDCSPRCSSLPNSQHRSAMHRSPVTPSTPLSSHASSFFGSASTSVSSLSRPASQLSSSCPYGYSRVHASAAQPLSHLGTTVGQSLHSGSVLLADKIAWATSLLALYAPYLPAVALPALPALPSLGELWRSCASSGVMGATVSASFKLCLLCGLVGYLLRRGSIPAETPTVLSQVAFNLMIPCVMFTSLAQTLSAGPHISLLAVPLAAALQMLLGWALGSLAAKVVDGSYSRSRTVLGWHPLNPARSASAIAASTAISAGIPMAAPALLPRPRSVPEGTSGLVQAACTFGNSLTLPMVFLVSLLAPPAAQRALGYTALFTMAWSPALWSAGYQMLSPASTTAAQEVERQRLSYVGTEADAVSSAQLALATRSGFKPAPISPTLVRASAGSAWQRFSSSSLGFIKQVVNPPLIGVLAGVAVGLSPLGPVLFQPSTAASSALTGGLHMELKLALGVMRASVEVLQILGGATVAMTAVVLGASMFQRQTATAAAKPDAKAGEGMAKEGGFLVWRWLRSVVPRDPVDARILAAVAVVRLLLMPLASLAIVAGLSALGWLPSDPVCALAILLQGAMPSSQSLVVLLQLRDSTRPLAPRCASLLLRLYALSVLPITLWVTVFVSRLPLPMALL